MRRRDFLVLLSGASLLRPRSTGAQQSKVRRLAIVHPSSPVENLIGAKSPLFYGPFFDGLQQQGFIEGQNLKVERYSGEGRPDRFAQLAQSVVASHPEVIFSLSGRLTRQFKTATTTIPIVGVVADPVASNIVSSLAHPGGNITGVVADAGSEFYAKHLEILRKINPTASRVAYLAPRGVWGSPQFTPLEEAAKQIGVLLIPTLLEPPADEGEFRRVFALITQEPPDGLIVADVAENATHRRLIVDLVEQARIIAVYPDRTFADQGGLISYGVNTPDLWRHAGGAVGQILQGAKPGDIPFYQASRFELVVNLKAAQALGLQMPPMILTAADEVIE